MQLEALSLWDLIDKYVFGPAPGVIRNLAAAAGVPEAEMREALQAFRASDEAKAGRWPAGPGPASKIEGWLLSLDSFGVKFMRYEFRRHSAHAFPPSSPNDRAANPQDDRFKDQFSEQWAKWWKKQFHGTPQATAEEERARKRRDFEARAGQFDRSSAAPPSTPPTPVEPTPPAPTPPSTPPRAAPPPGGGGLCGTVVLFLSSCVGAVVVLWRLAHL